MTSAAKSKRERIAPSRHAGRRHRLELNYGVDFGNFCLICAYSEEAEALKGRFLDHGTAYLRAIGQVLAASGFTEMEVRRNHAGIAVSGTVYAEYWHPALPCWLYTWLEASSLRPAGESRPDGLVLVARKRVIRGVRVVEGINHFFLPNGTAGALAKELLPILGQAPAIQAPPQVEQQGLFEEERAF
jgi:hypothetical protein